MNNGNNIATEDAEMNELEKEIMAAVHEHGDPLMYDIQAELARESETVRRAVLDLVHRGMLRMKDDDIDHDWTYRMTRQGKEAFGYGQGQ